MAKQRPSKVSPRASAASPAAPPVRSMRELAILAGIGTLLCLVTGYLSRLALNPDGVSYLDLASAVQRNDWSQFVQGYWSPFLPLVAGLAGRLAGVTGPQLVPLVHAFNTCAAIGGLAILATWAYRSRQPLFGRAAIAAFLLVSAGLPRIEAVTPDVLLLATMTWLGYELLAQCGRRPLATGLALGLAFLVKTSTWPWLVIAIPFRLWAARDAAARRSVLWSNAVAAIVVLFWAIPLSVKSGHPTLGSSGRLNYSWYIEANSSRLPDTDLGEHAAYREVPVGSQQEVTLVSFDDAAHWTYQPWGDPTAWAAGVQSETGHPPAAGALIAYWSRQAGRIAGLWLLPMLVAILLPVYLLRRRPGIWRDWIGAGRDSLAVTLLGVAGLVQFAVVHAEPRLIAPFGMMVALGALSWWCNDGASGPASDRVWWRVALGWIGMLAAVGFAVPKLVNGIADSARLERIVGDLATLRSRLGASGGSQVDLAIVGPAAPVLSAAYMLGAHVTAQLPPRSAPVISAMPPEEQSRVFTALFGGRAALIWKTTADGGMEMLLMPRR